MPPAKTRSRSKQDASMPSNPKEQQRFVAILKQLHEEVNSGNLQVTMQAMPKLVELHNQFPKNVNVLVLLGRGYMAIRNLPKSIEFYAKAAKLMPTEPDINFQYGIALENHSHLQHALDRFDRVLQKQPNHFYALRHRVTTLDAMGNREEAFEGYKALVEKFKDKDLLDDQVNALAITAAAFAPEYTDARESLDTLEERIETTRDKDLARAGSSQLARLHKHLKEYDESFEWYTKGKAIDKDEWDCDLYSQAVDQLIECWRNHEIPTSQTKGIDSSRLIFIVGMPRSGTSLTEQMLAQLKDLEPGGEMNVIDGLIPRNEKMIHRHVSRLPLTHRFYTHHAIDTMSREAMREYNKVDRRKSVTDKQPYNYALVPMIMHLFPEARIIHCTRDAMDCCFSNFTTAFTQLHMQTHDLYWLGRYYADYERVMLAWRELPGMRMIDLPYEDLVREPETEMRRVLDFLDFEWDEQVLRFHESERTVITASRDQVRKKIYTSAIAKYAPYEHHLDELKRGIEEGRARPHGG